MFMIIDEDGRYFAGNICGCNVFKDHRTRGLEFVEVTDALDAMHKYDLTDTCKIVG